MGLLALGIGAGFGVAAYQNLPPMYPLAIQVVGIVWWLSMFGAWLAGRSNGRQWQWQQQEQHQDQEQEQRQAQQVIVNVNTEKGGLAPPNGGVAARPERSDLALGYVEVQLPGLEAPDRVGKELEPLAPARGNESVREPESDHVPLAVVYEQRRIAAAEERNRQHAVTESGQH